MFAKYVENKPGKQCKGETKEEFGGK